MLISEYFSPDSIVYGIVSDTTNDLNNLVPRGSDVD